MNFLYQIINNLSLFDYLIISYLLLLTSYDNYLRAINLHGLSFKYRESEKKIYIDFLYFGIVFFTYLLSAIVSYLSSSFIILLLTFGIFPFILFLISLRLFKERLLIVGSSYFFQNTTFSFPNALVNIAFYLLIATLIIPTEKLLGVFLILLFLFPRTVSLFFLRTPKNNSRIFIANFRLRILLSSINTISIVLILIFSFSFSIQYRGDFEKRIANDVSIKSIQQNISDFEKSTNDLSLSLSNLVVAQKVAQNKLDTLQILFKSINQDIENIALRKIKLEDKVVLLQNKSESEIRNDAIYIAISDVINKNQYSTLVFSLIIGIITGFIANFIFMKVTRNEE